MSASFLRARRQKGFSLIEILLVLGVIAILAIAAFVIYPSVRNRSQANSEVQNLNSIKASINTLYSASGGNYRTLTAGIANQARVFPSSMNGSNFSASAPIVSSWGGSVSLVVNTAATTTTQTPGGSIPANRSFSITYADVPAAVCLPLVTGASISFQGVRVGTTEVMAAADGAQAGVDPALAAVACGAGSPTVVFTSS